MPAKGFYTTVRGSVIHGFGVAVDSRGVRWYLCVVVVPGRIEQCLDTDSGSARGGTRLTDLAIA